MNYLFIVFLSNYFVQFITSIYFFLFQLEKDFEKLYPDAYMKLYAEWAKLSCFIEKKFTKIEPKFKEHLNPGMTNMCVLALKFIVI